MKAEKVLCVDDEPSILDAYRRQLRTRFTIVTAGSGEEGLAAISKDGPFAVIVSDMRMPGMDGAQFLIASSPSWASTTSCLAVSSILRMICRRR